MPQAEANGISIEYESFGSQSSQAVLLIQGLSGQLVHWPVELCHELVARGFRAIRFDNRDVGLSTKLDGAITPNMLQMLGARFLKLRGFLAYTLDDMAKDAIGLLDALEIRRAHIAGASMGGIIAQLIAVDHADRALSLTSIMSTSGRPGLPGPRPEVREAMMAPYPPPGDMEAIIARSLRLRRAMASPGFPVSDAEIRRIAETAIKRCYYPPGIARQLAATMVAGDRCEKLAQIRVPTVVLHGRDDPMVPVEAGIDTAHHIPGAELRVVPGMGHDFPVSLVATIADAICRAAERAESIV